jgi:hypothetical protein
VTAENTAREECHSERSEESALLLFRIAIAEQIPRFRLGMTHVICPEKRYRPLLAGGTTPFMRRYSTIWPYSSAA